MAVGRAEDVVDVEDVVGVLVVHALVARRDRRLGEDAPRIVRVLVAERRIDGLVCRREVRRERAQGLLDQRRHERSERTDKGAPEASVLRPCGRSRTTGRRSYAPSRSRRKPVCGGAERGLGGGRGA